jgi:HEAT repeat protein
VAALVENVDDEAAAVAFASRQALETIGPGSRRDVDRLIALLTHPNLAVRRHAVDALGHMGPAAMAAVTALVPLLADRDRLLEIHADKALARIDPGWQTNCRAGQAIAILAKKLDADDRRIRQRAAEALGRLGPVARPAITPLVKKLTDPEEYVRISAEMALDAIDPAWRSEVYFLGPKGCGVAEGRIG